MGTAVTIRVVREETGVAEAVARAMGWFHEMEARCTRFRPESELMRLTARTGEAVPVSTMLFEAVRFALLVADETGGAFDPTVGHRMAARGFNREHRTGETVSCGGAEAGASYRDVLIDESARTVTLQRRLTLDLGAVAKGLAVDAAARELASFRDFCINAGGDVYAGGVNEAGEAWRVGIRHPRRDGELIECLRVSNQAVCTSGDYERGAHILDGLTGEAAESLASVTVVAPGAMTADALATAAFALGPNEGLALLERMGVDGLLVTPDLERRQTRGLRLAA